jgi:hypothetical protein
MHAHPITHCTTYVYNVQLEANTAANDLDPQMRRIKQFKQLASHRLLE